MKLYKNTNWVQVSLNGNDIDIPTNWEPVYLGSEKIPFVKSGVKIYQGAVDYYATREVNNFSLGIMPTGKFTYDKRPSRANVSVLNNSIYMARMKNTLKIIKFESSKSFLLSSGFLGILPNTSYISLSYLYYVIRSREFQNSKNKECKGATQETLSDSAAKKIKVLCPNSKQEQDAIASLLESQESIINKTKDIISSFENLNNFMVHSLLSGSVRVREENGDFVLYKNLEDNWKPVRINNEVADIPKDWEQITIKNSFKESQKSKMAAKTGRKNGSYPFFNCSEKQTLKVDTYLIDEDVLYLSTGGKPSVQHSVGKSAYSSHVWAISFKEHFNNEFIYYYLKNYPDILERCFKGSGLRHLNKKDFANTEIFKPLLNEQKLIVSVLQEITNRKKKYELLLKKEEDIFEFLLEELLSGRLRVKV